MNAAASPLQVSVSPNFKGLLLRLAGGVFLFDLCFWNLNETPGLTIPVFIAGLASLLLFNGRKEKLSFTVSGLLALLAGAVGAGVVETGLSNTSVFFFLIVALAGELHFGAISSSWGRWMSQGLALLRAPGRPFWLAARLLESCGQRKSRPLQVWFHGFLVAGPALLLAVLFGSLLAGGNPVFEQWSDRFFSGLWADLVPYLNMARMLFWIVGLFLLLPLLRPVTPGEWWWRWSLQLPRLDIPVSGPVARQSSFVTLALLNLLFLAANFADALFLWSGESLPAGVTYSQYVHEGVTSLIMAVILSAVVLTVIFQQALAVSKRRELKVLAAIWIVQNLFLLVSVALRLKSYIEAYDMTVERLSLLLFLAMVAIGYGLLTIQIGREKSLSWLLGGGILAAVGTLYVAQFLNLAGWSADYNVRQWEANRSRDLDIRYLQSLGAPAWPALRRVAGLDPEKENLKQQLESPCFIEACEKISTFDSAKWRSWSARAAWNRWAIENKDNLK